MSDFIAFAGRFSIKVEEAYVLPALFERAAQLVGMSPAALLAQATYSNQALGDYLADAARKVAREDRA